MRKARPVRSRRASGAKGAGVSGAGGNSAGAVKTSGGDVYAGADGNVYKKTSDGWSEVRQRFVERRAESDGAAQANSSCGDSAATASRSDAGRRQRSTCEAVGPGPPGAHAGRPAAAAVQRVARGRARFAQHDGAQRRRTTLTRSVRGCDPHGRSAMATKESTMTLSGIPSRPAGPRHRADARFRLRGSPMGVGGAARDRPRRADVAAVAAERRPELRLGGGDARGAGRQGLRGGPARVARAQEGHHDHARGQRPQCSSSSPTANRSPESR